MTTSKNVCVCVDDYGYDEASNRAAIALADMRSISAISVLVQAPHASMGSQQLLALRQTCALGLHLNLTEVFTQNDFALPLKPLIVASHLHGLSKEKMSQAIHAQLDIFERIYKIPPDFIDGHEHVHVLPMVRSLLLDILKSRYPCLPVLRIPLSSCLDFKSWVVSKVGAKTLRWRLVTGLE
jgi:chitin disaccharide deacetylase